MDNNRSDTRITTASGPKQPKKAELEPIFISQEEAWTMAGLGKTVYYELKKLGWFKVYSNADSSIPGSARVAVNRVEFIEDATRYWNSKTPRHQAEGA